MADKTLEERETLEKTHKAHMAQEAKRLLTDPMIDSFFRNQEVETLEAIKNLPLGAGLDVYQTIHHNLLASMRLKRNLESYINDFESMIIQDKLLDMDIDGI